MSDLEVGVQPTIDHAKLLAAAVACLAEGVLITDDHLAWPGPRIVFVNEDICQITGYAAEELVGPARERNRLKCAEPRAPVRKGARFGKHSPGLVLVNATTTEWHGFCLKG